jgi:ribosome maturation factor RimP
MENKRYIREIGIEARIAALVTPIAEDLGYRLVRVRILNQNGTTLQIMAEDANGRFSIDDCEALSRELNPALDVEDPIDREYHLEVSSPGIDRPLVRAGDFAKWQGHEAKIEMADMVDGRRRFRGTIETSDADGVTIRLPDLPADADPLFVLPFAGIAEAKLVMTDRLLEMAAKEQELDETLDDPDIETVEVDKDEEIN